MAPDADYLTKLYGLEGRTAVVTGASSGIGCAIAQALGRAGAGLFLVGRDPHRLRAAEQQLVSYGCMVTAISADLAEREGIDHVVEQTRGSQVDILVNSAGVNVRPSMGDLSDNDITQTLAVNLQAPLLLGQHYGPLMAGRGWGRIINIGSQQSVRAFGNSGVYGVSKAGITGLSRSQAEAWSANGVCSNTIVPGFVETAMTQHVVAEPGRSAALAARTHVGRNGLAPDFAGAAVFLASDASSYVTGQMLFVDGGFSVA